MAYDVFKLFATDEKKELEGVKIPLGGGASITVARADNDNFLTKIVEASERNLAELKALPKEEAAKLDKELLRDVLAETVLLGFEGMSYDGKPIKYSMENAKKLLGHKDFLRMVMKRANEIEHFRLAQETEDVKN